MRILQISSNQQGAESDDPLAPKIQFPDVPTCLSCRIEGNQAAWHYRNVKRFLKNHYRNITGVVGSRSGSSSASNNGLSSSNADSKKVKNSFGIESIEGFVEKPRRRHVPGELARIKEQRREKRKNDVKSLDGDHVDVKVRREVTALLVVSSVGPFVLSFTFFASSFLALLLQACI